MRDQGLGSFTGPYIDQAAQTLTDFGTNIQQKDIDEVLRETEQFRPRPACSVPGRSGPAGLCRRPVPEKLQQPGRNDSLTREEKAMSKHASKPQWHEPINQIGSEVDDPIEDTVDVGEVMLIDGPLDPVPLNIGSKKY